MSIPRVTYQDISSPSIMNKSTTYTSKEVHQLITAFYRSMQFKTTMEFELEKMKKEQILYDEWHCLRNNYEFIRTLRQ
jgi:hypothetical protein